MPIENIYSTLTDEEVAAVMVQLVDCIIFINSIGIKHQDIHPLNNIQYDKEKKKVRLIDFDSAVLDPLNIEKCSKNDLKQLIECLSELWMGEKYREEEEIEFFGKKIKTYYGFDCGNSEFEVELADLLTCFYAAINKEYVTPVMLAEELRRIISKHFKGIKLPDQQKLDKDQLEYNMRCMYDVGYLVD